MLEIKDHITATDELYEAEKSQRGGDKYQEALSLLVENVSDRYQEWYTESCALIKQMLPNRLSEFEALYAGLKGAHRVPIQQWLLAGGLAGHHLGSSFDNLESTIRAQGMLQTSSKASWGLFARPTGDLRVLSLTSNRLSKPTLLIQSSEPQPS